MGRANIRTKNIPLGEIWSFSFSPDLGPGEFLFALTTHMPSPLRAERGGDHPAGLDDDNADDPAEHTPTEGEPPAKRMRGTALGAAKSVLAGYMYALKVNDLQLAIATTLTMNEMQNASEMHSHWEGSTRCVRNAQCAFAPANMENAH